MFAKVRAKTSERMIYNGRAIFRKPINVDEVLALPKMFLNLIRLQCCPLTCGDAATIICSEDFTKKH